MISGPPAQPASPDQQAPGWYGKLPFLGDFAGRRLPTSFVSTWDDWLQNVIYGSRALLGADWLELYLNSPVWHYCLAPGVCGNHAWFGVLMSSVDRANRHFPFTLAHGVPRETLHDLPLNAMVRWLDGLEGAAIAMLDLNGAVQQLEDRLLDYPPPPPAGLDETQPSIANHLPRDGQPATMIPAEVVPSELAAFVRDTARGQTSAGINTLWWTGPDDNGQALMLGCRGLPDADRYSGMLAGN